MQNDQHRFFKNEIHNRIISTLAVTGLSLVMSGCNTSPVNHSIVTEKKIPDARITLTPPKDDIKKDTGINKDQAKPLKNSKLAVFEAQRPKSGEAVGGYTAALSGTLRVKENCVVIILKNGSAVQPIFASYTVVWNDTTNTLIHNGKQYREGDDIYLGGGLMPAAYFENLSNKYIPDCPNSSLFLTNR